MTDSILGSEALKVRPDLTRRLHTTAKRFVKVARIANEEPASEGKDRAEFVETEGKFPTYERILDKSHETESTVGPSRSTKAHRTQPLENHFHLSKNILGNGWFDQVPSIHRNRNSPWNPEKDSLAMNLLRQTLASAYNNLLNNASHSNRSFRSALKFHSPEELLFNLRWFLGPGVSSLRSLAPPIFGFRGSVVWEAGKVLPRRFGPAQILHPEVDLSAFGELGGDEGGMVMNADGVETYLRSKGAFYFDRDVVCMDLGEYRKPGLGALGADGQQRSWETSSRIPREDELILPMLPVSSTQHTVHPDRLFPHAVPHATESIAYPASEPTAPAHRYITLSVSIFIQELSQLALCLGNGPGFVQYAIDQAILASVVEES